jgi:thymidylate synthase (FAD)
MIEVTYIDHMGNDLSVVNAARVSFGKKSDFVYYCHQCIKQGNECGHDWEGGMQRKLQDRDTKLVRYLANHKHISPFGHCFASFHVKAPIFVARQLVKHKFLRWNEISRRYVDDEPEFYEPKQWRGRSADKKQGSEGVVNITLDQEVQWNRQLSTYKTLLSEGVAPEQARIVLPQSMMTEWYWSGSLDAFADMCRLRCKEDTQAETQEVAWAISLKMEDLFPVSWVALRDE